MLADGIALAGAGIADTTERLARDDIASGGLIDVLPAAARELDVLLLDVPRRTGDVPTIRALILAARATLAASGRAPV